MTMFLRNSCSQNSQQQILKRKADQPLSSALPTDGAHSKDLLSQTVFSSFCLRFWETSNIPKYNQKTFYTHYYFICLHLLLENFCQTASKHKAKKYRLFPAKAKYSAISLSLWRKGLNSGWARVWDCGRDVGSVPAKSFLTTPQARGITGLEEWRRSKGEGIANPQFIHGQQIY